MAQDGDREIRIVVSCEPVYTEMTAQGVSWSSDVADDMLRRVLDAFRTAMGVAGEAGVLLPVLTDEEIGSDDQSDGME